ncbi:ABC transporter ATP-binding protein [Bacillus sp. AFS029637]|uniref:ABC transporter ATP-binding protein n=1 Tax=Bacillus sp. AFS029637 TaxID=2033495 RepID=UPI000BFE276F|nr:ABC transporter ATP-binding protein [Bacillus sp. AFS029637]PGZ68486.1 ABC transporter [Bacillus sp. AFS029637]
MKMLQNQEHSVDRLKNKQRYLLDQLKTMKLIGTMIWGSGPLLIILIFLFMLIQGLIPAIQLFSSKQIIDGISAKGESSDISIIWACIYAISMILMVLLDSIKKWIGKILSERSLLSINLLLLEAWEKVPGMKFFDEKKYRNRLDTLQDATGWLPSQIITVSINFITGLISIGGIILLIGSLSPILAVLLVLSTIPYALKQNKYGELDWEYEKELAEDRRRMNYARDMLLGRRASKEVRLFSLESFFLKLYRMKFQNIFTRFKIMQKSFVRGSILTGLLSGIVAGLGYLWIIYQISNESISLGDIALYLLAIFQLSKELMGVSNDGADALELWRMGTDFRIFIESEPDIHQVPNPQTGLYGEPMSIEFRNVTFKYPYGKHEEEEEEDDDDDDEYEYEYEEDDDSLEDYDIDSHASFDDQDNDREYILNNVSFKILPGEHVALVGGNGSGKTTIVKLLCRFYEPTSGSILINGRDIKTLDINELRSNISAIFQDYGKYSLTVEENITISDLQRQDKQKLKEVATIAQVDEFIKKLPNKYNSLLGPEWGGEDLSGGQWQRIAIARAIYQDSDLIIMDEPTAALDIRAEYELYNNFRALAKGKSVLLISHRFSTVKMANRILVLKNGSIVEEGEHKQLMELGGEYAKMYKVQAEYFYENKD